MLTLIIHDDMKALSLPLPAEKYAELKEGLLEYGCVLPLYVWDGILLDGHKRYEICAKHAIPFFYESFDFNSFDEALFWAWHNHVSERDLTTYRRAEFVLAFQKIVLPKPQLREEIFEDQENAAVWSDNRILKELGKLAGVSVTTIRMVEFLDRHADSMVKDRLRQGVPGVNITGEFFRLKYDPPKLEPEIVPPPQKTEEKSALSIRNFLSGFPKWFQKLRASKTQNVAPKRLSRELIFETIVTMDQ